jgi:hypothetical protein
MVETRKIKIEKVKYRNLKEFGIFLEIIIQF